MWYSRSAMRTLLVAVATSVPTHSLHAQLPLLTCVQPAEAKAGEGCVITLPRNPGAAVIVVKLEQGGVALPTHRVTFHSTTGDAILDTTDVTNARGEARTTWSGTVGQTPALVTARTTVAGREATLSIQIKQPGPSPTALGIIPERSDDEQTWYEERQLRKPITVLISGARTPEACNAAQVVFRPTGGGAATPDTVRGVLEGGTCRAEARWRLGQGVGEQHLRASLVGEPAKGALFRAAARARPRLTTGLVVAYASGYDRLVERADTVTVTHDFGDSTVVTKRITRTNELKEIDYEWEMAPVLGFDWPLWPDWHWLRVSVAASLEDPTHDWYAGLSLLQLGLGLPHESVGATLHVVGHVSRRDIVDNADDCTPESCDTDDDLQFTGLGLMFTVGGLDLLGNLATIFGIQ